MSYTPGQRSRDWRFIWATPEGRRAIADLLGRCGLFLPIYDDRPERLAFNEGRRNVALDIVQALSITPDQWKTLLEAMQETESDD